jgi:hypothetical protein
MSAEEDLVELQARLDEVTAEKASLERVLGAVLEVVSDAQWGEVRARLDAEDKAAR